MFPSLALLIQKLRHEKVSDLLETLYDLYVQESYRNKVYLVMVNVIQSLPECLENGGSIVSEEQMHSRQLVRLIVDFWMARLLANITPVSYAYLMCLSY